MSENSHSMAARAPQVWERVPKRNPNFTGRADLLLALRKSISPVTAVVAQPMALQGLGGVGKTQLAVEYAWQYRTHYDLVWWVSADQPMLVPSALAAMATALGLPPATSTGVEQAAQSVLRALQSGVPYRSWLMIFDNAEEPDLIKDYIPRGTGHVIITSRNSRWSDYEDTVAVDVFKREESMAFLLKRLAGAVTEPEANQVAEVLGDLPLALEQAAALLSRTLMPVDEYVGLVKKRTGAVLNLEKSPTYPQSMTAAWQVSVSQLEDRVPAAVEVLRCCAFFGPEPIPRDVFRRGNQAVGPRLAQILSDPIMLTNALSNLERLALVKVEPSTRTLQVHRLNQALLRDETSPEDREELRHEVHMLLAGTAPSDPDDTARWSRFEELAAHLEPSGLIECTVPAVRKFALDLVRYLYVRGSYKQAQALLDQYIAKWTQDSGPRHADVLKARIHLGLVYLGLTFYTRASELMSETLQVMTEELGPDRPETLWAKKSYAAALRGRGEFFQARQGDQELLEAYERASGERDPDTLQARNNLAVDYALTSDYDTASKLLQEAYLHMSSREGIGRRVLLTAWSNLSRAVRLSGQFEVATDVAEEAYAYGVAQLGDDHPITLLAAKDYAISLRRSGRLGEALELMKSTHTRLHRLYGDVHADTMAAAIGLSNALRADGDLEEALRMAKRGLDHYPDVFGSEHPFTHACNLNLALLTRLNGDPAKAREISERALAGLTERLGRDHDYTVSCAINLQNDLAALGLHDEARRLGEENLRRIRASFHPDHYLSLVCAANLSLDLRATGAEKEAEQLLSDTTRRLDAVLGRDHPETLSVLAGERLNSDFDPPPI
ncbi:FxSxx-COOH system tetratricopeptide repeat protein [Nonomuraea sp. NPDC049400]|uniref:FxSxx-COOH system tetratricopeptide repeat protein n=1 Tax=Nonomuraea sp. NPDC049400 TaxID=3364352 RepID=UPI0037B52F55